VPEDAGDRSPAIRSVGLGVGARKVRALLLDLAKHSGGVAAKHLPSVFWRPLPTARPGHHVNCGLKTFVDLAAPNLFGRLCLERDLSRDPPPAASRLNEDERADEIRIILGCPESDMPASGVNEQVKRSRLQRGNETPDIHRVLPRGEIIAFTVPFFRPAMPEADAYCAVMRAEGLI
jgi:hypothetical protein